MNKGETKEKNKLPEKKEDKFSLEKELNKKKQDYDQLWDKYLRLCAEFDNARKRWERERGEIIKFSNFSLLKEILIIGDEIEQALKAVKEHTQREEILKGLEIMANNFSNILKKNGVREISTEDKKFNPYFHEIVASREINSDRDEPLVLEVVQKGYLLEDKVLRTAKVIVGMKSRPKTEDQRPRTNEKMSNE